MARIKIEYERNKTKSNEIDSYSVKRISKQVSILNSELFDRIKTIERNEKDSWKRARNRNVG